MKTFKLEICQGVAGEAVYLNDFRIAGSRHNGLMRTTRSWAVRLDDLLDASAIEARSDATPQSDAAEGESATRQGDAQ